MERLLDLGWAAAPLYRQTAQRLSQAASQEF